MNEVATDYNAGFTSALARLAQEYGGTPLANFPTPETPDLDELTVETTVMQAEPRATGLKAIVYNRSGFPARALTDGRFRYYFRPDGPGPVQVTPGYTQGCPAPTSARQHSGDIWYVEVDCTGHTIAPAGQSQHRMEVQFKVGVPEGGTWDPTNDPSYQADTGPNRRVPLYSGGTRVWGEEPGPATPDTTAPTVPGTPVASVVTPTGLTLTWPAATDAGGSGLAGYEVTQEQVGSDALVLLTAATNSLAVTGLTPERTYRFSVRARDGAGNRSAASPVLEVTTPVTPTPTGDCRVGYVTSDWSTGFTANITITNTGTATLNGWTLTFSFPSTGQRVGQGWSATYNQTGTAVTATNVSYNGGLAPGASTSFGFNGTHTGSNPKPTAFTLNGAPCALG